MTLNTYILRRDRVVREEITIQAHTLAEALEFTQSEQGIDSALWKRDLADRVRTEGPYEVDEHTVDGHHARYTNLVESHSNAFEGNGRLYAYSLRGDGVLDYGPDIGPYSGPYRGVEHDPEEDPT